VRELLESRRSQRSAASISSPGRPGANRHAVIWIVTVVTATALLAAVLRTGAALLSSRHATVLFLPVVLLALAAFELIRWKSFIRVWAGIFLFFSAASLVATYTPLAKFGDWERVAEHIESNEKPGEPILIVLGSDSLPLSHYYRGTNRVVPIPREDRLQRYDIRHDVIDDAAEVSGLLAELPPHERAWLVTEHACRFMDLDFNCGILEDEISRSYTVEGSEEFYRSSVRLLRRRAGPP
jgi:hypothetical protein